MPTWKYQKAGGGVKLLPVSTQVPDRLPSKIKTEGAAPASPVSLLKSLRDWTIKDSGGGSSSSVDTNTYHNTKNSSMFRLGTGATTEDQTHLSKQNVDDVLEIITRQHQQRISVLDQNTKVFPDSNLTLLPVFQDGQWTLGYYSAAGLAVYESLPDLSRREAMVEYFQDYRKTQRGLLVTITAPLIRPKFHDSGVYLLVTAMLLIAECDLPSSIDYDFWKEVLKHILPSHVDYRVISQPSLSNTPSSSGRLDLANFGLSAGVSPDCQGCFFHNNRKVRIKNFSLEMLPKYRQSLQSAEKACHALSKLTKVPSKKGGRAASENSRRVMRALQFAKSSKSCLQSEIDRLVVQGN
ncbi:hypothetical protein D7B24_004641 [Verticillium nonalfalfae]|uniref:Uncharacterized protein n=1 Tax=Verticillium nonalfalfae TaxID=1051616 RepID=A0A3M9XUS2_9PEZI|nr:uncharacterized protein D7B24_004641 [Verticillium nonalfalfae]RNJ52033.1 hypothetical protein D7B24_004641 [Verticillium nonalfalfae]